MRINRHGFQQFSGSIDHSHFAAGTVTRIEPEHGLGACRSRQQQFTQVPAENPDRLCFCRFTHLQQQFSSEMQMYFDTPGPLANIPKPFIRFPITVFDPEMCCNHGDAGMWNALPGCFVQIQIDSEHAQRTTAKQCQCTVRWNQPYRFGISVIVTEFFFLCLFLTGNNYRSHHPLLPELATQYNEQIRCLRKAFSQNIARTFKRCFRIGNIDRFHPLSSRHHLDIFCSFLLRVECVVCQKRIRQRLQSSFTCDLCPGTTLRPVRQINIFQKLPGSSLIDDMTQFIGELALLLDRSQDNLPSCFQLTQISQPLFQQSQLCIVQVTGRLFAISRNKGYGCPLIQQHYRCADLPRCDIKFCGDGVDDFFLRWL
ncbi:MAG: hypothetical protein JNIBNLAF_02026 [Nitrosomonas europaea]|nr:hypothetical protein [Nitrosomonas europaea]